MTDYSVRFSVSKYDGSRESSMLGGSANVLEINFMVPVSDESRKQLQKLVDEMIEFSGYGRPAADWRNGE